MFACTSIIPQKAQSSEWIPDPWIAVDQWSPKIQLISFPCPFPHVCFCSSDACLSISLPMQNEKQCFPANAANILPRSNMSIVKKDSKDAKHSKDTDETDDTNNSFHAADPGSDPVGPIRCPSVGEPESPILAFSQFPCSWGSAGHLIGQISVNHIPYFNTQYYL